MRTWGLSIWWLLTATAAETQVFSDVTIEVGFTAEEPAPGAAWGDYDGDGDLDIYVSNIFGPGQLYDSADGLFANITAEAGMGAEGNSSGIAWADYDNDGDLDLFVGNPFGPSALYENQGDGLFGERAEQAGIQGESGSLSVSWGDYNGDGHVDLFVGAISPESNPPSRFYHNDGDGTFVDLLAQADIRIYAFAIAWGDYDNDGDLDLYMSNNHLSEDINPSPNFYWRNDGDGAFVDVAEAAGVAGGDWSVGVAGGDMDNDGDLDLYVATNGGPNRLYRNLGEGQFDEVGASAGVADDKEAFEFSNAVAWVDYDADGYLDLFLANDLVGPPIRLYRNRGAGVLGFADVAPDVGLDHEVGWGAAWGDYDGDGDPDLYLTGFEHEDGGILGAPDRLFRNDGGVNRWLRMELVGTGNNRSAIGTRVVAVDGARRQMREVDGGSGLYSQGDLAVEFGFGSAVVVDSLLIRWPSGVEQILTKVATNQRLLVREGDDTPTAVEGVGEGMPEDFALEQNYPNPFNAETVIAFSLVAAESVRLEIFNPLGQKVKTLVDALLRSGAYRVVWDGRDEQGRDAASGVYSYRLIAGEWSVTRQLTLVR